MDKKTNKKRRNLKATISCLIIIAMTATSVSSASTWQEYESLGSSQNNDASEGMPDFDQRQDEDWVFLGEKNYCGATSAANALWYLDCRHDTYGQTNYNLIEEAHSASLVHDLIEEIEDCDLIDYNGRTEPLLMMNALNQFFFIKNVSKNYSVSLVFKPTLSQVANWVGSSDVVLLESRYGSSPKIPWNVHWVSVQGALANATNSGSIKISDPCHDEPNDPFSAYDMGHPIYGTHNNTSIVKHDQYNATETTHTDNIGFELERIWSKPTWNLFVRCAVIIKEITHPSRTISITSCTPYDSDNNGNNDSVSVTYSAGTNIATNGTIQAKLINPSNTTVSSRIAEVALTASQPTNGVLNLTLPSNQLSNVYTVRVEISENFSSPIDDVDTATVNLTPVTIHAYFWYNNEECNKTVEFTDASYTSAGCTLTNWNWDFDDGTTSTAENPDHTYNYTGIYDVTLTVADDYGNNDTTTIPITITGTTPNGKINLTSSELQTYMQPMTVRSSVDDTDNPVPLSGSAYNFSWTMGDGTTYYTQNVTHNYSKGGTYTVSMTVTDLDNYTDTCTMEYFTPDILVQSGSTDNHSINRWNSLSEGINAASAGDIISIGNGAYEAQLSLDYNLTLVGECQENVLLKEPGLLLNSDNIKLYNMTLISGTTAITINNQNNITLSNLQICNMTYGINIINNSDNITIDSSSFKNNTYGVYAADSTNLTIGKYTEEINETFNNTIFVENTQAIYLDNMADVNIFSIDINATIPSILSTPPPTPTYGIDMDDTQQVIIHSAHIYNAHTSAINIDESRFVEIICSHIEENPYGVYCTAARDCLIGGCLLKDNDHYGVTFSDLRCRDNTVILNDFINNTAYDSSDRRGPTTWTFTAKTGFTMGNYWNTSGLLFEDNDNDGISDDALSLAGPPRSDPEDPLPVMTRHRWVS